MSKQASFLAMDEDNQRYPRPAFTADVVPLRFCGGRLEILLIKRKSVPFRGCYALPGGFVDPNEMPSQAAVRELSEETGLTTIELIESGVFGQPGRDPRGWVVSAAFIGLVDHTASAYAGDDAAQVSWFPIQDLPDLAFDHGEIIEHAKAILRRISLSDTRILKILGPSFRTAQARHLFSQIWQQPISPRPFKAWLRRRAAVHRVGPGRFEPNPSLSPDWLR